MVNNDKNQIFWKIFSQWRRSVPTNFFIILDVDLHEQSKNNIKFSNFRGHRVLRAKKLAPPSLKFFFKIFFGLKPLKSVFPFNFVSIDTYPINVAPLDAEIFKFKILHFSKFQNFENGVAPLLGLAVPHTKSSFYSLIMLISYVDGKIKSLVVFYFLKNIHLRFFFTMFLYYIFFQWNSQNPLQFDPKKGK